MCGKQYTPKRASSKYCGSTCRTRATRLRAEQPPAPAAAAPAADPPAQPSLPTLLVARTMQQLEEAGRLDTVLGQQALVLASRLEVITALDTGASMAAVSKELRAVMTEAMTGVAVAEDPIDELRRRREAKHVG